MNPPPPKDGSPTPPPAPSPREELEARLAALVLGEAGEFEAETLRARLAADPELAALHRRLTSAAQALKDTFEDERTAAALPFVPAAPGQLSPERRAVLEKLFAPATDAAASSAAEGAATVATPAPAREITRRQSPFIIFPKLPRQFLVAAACLIMAGLIGYLTMSNLSTVYEMSGETFAAKPQVTTAVTGFQYAEFAEPAEARAKKLEESYGLLGRDEPGMQPPSEKILSASELVAAVSNTPGTEPLSSLPALTPAINTSSSLSLNSLGEQPNSSPFAAGEAPGSRGNDALTVDRLWVSRGGPPAADAAAPAPARRAITMFDVNRSASSLSPAPAAVVTDMLQQPQQQESILADALNFSIAAPLSDASPPAPAAAVALASPSPPPPPPPPAVTPGLARGSRGALGAGGSALAGQGQGQGARRAGPGSVAANPGARRGNRGSGLPSATPAQGAGAAPAGSSSNTASAEANNTLAALNTAGANSSFTGNLVINGNNPVPLGNNTYTGGTTVSAGTLTVGNSLALQNSTLRYYTGGGDLSFGVLSNATIGGLSSDRSLALAETDAKDISDLGGNNVRVGSAFSGFGSLLRVDNGVTTLTGSDFQSTTFVGTISGNGNSGLTKAGAGTLTLTRTNTYTGGTVLNAGNTTVTGGSVNFNSQSNFGAANVTLAGGSLQWTTDTTAQLANSGNQPRQVEIDSRFLDVQQGVVGELGARAAVEDERPQIVEALQQRLANGGGGGAQGTTNNTLLSKTGSGTLILTGNATYGNLSSTNGTDNLQINNAGSTAAPAPVRARLAQIVAPPAAPPPNADQPVARPASDVKFPPPVAAADNAFSTFSLNVSDVAYRLALAALQNRRWPDPAATRTEEFLNAFNYHDPAPRPGQPGALNYELGQNPFESGGDLLRVSFQTAASGRDRATPLRLTIVLDGSGSMTRADRVATLQAAINALGGQLRAGDVVSLVMFARTAQVRAIGVPAERFAEIARLVDTAVPDGGTNLEEALMVGYQIARETFLQNAQNRVILLTDGAANLGQLDPKLLAGLVEDNRRAGIALDAYGVGWDGYDDTVLEALTRNSDGRYGFLNRPEDVDAAFASKLAGALAPAAADVKLQIEFNPNRVASYRLMGYNNQRLTKEQFRDNTVNAAELAAAEQGTALYNLVLKSNGTGPVGVARARFRDPATNVVREMSWTIRYNGAPPPFDQAAPSMRLAATAAYFAEYLQQSPFAAEVTPRKLMQTLEGVPEAFAPDPRPAALADALFSAAALAGN